MWYPLLKAFIWHLLPPCTHVTLVKAKEPLCHTCPLSLHKSVVNWVSFAFVHTGLLQFVLLPPLLPVIFLLLFLPRVLFPLFSSQCHRVQMWLAVSRFCSWYGSGSLHHSLFIYTRASFLPTLVFMSGSSDGKPVSLCYWRWRCWGCGCCEMLQFVCHKVRVICGKLNEVIASYFG